MREGWRLVTLKDVADIEMGQSPPGDTYNEIEEGLPFLQGSAEFGDRHPSPVKWCSAPKKRAQPGDLLVSVRAPVGDLNIADQEIAIGRGLAAVRGRPGAATTALLALALEFRRRELEARAGGGMFKSITKAALADLEIWIQTADEQRRIVDLISSIDHAIWAAEMTMEAAHSAAREFLRQAFTQLTGRQSTLGDIAFYINGYPFKPQELGSEGVPVIRIKQLLNPNEVPDRTTVDVPDRHRISDGDLIFSWSGTLATKMWDRGPAILNQHLFKVVEREGIDRAWLRLALEHAIEQLETMTHGTTMKHITKAKMMPYPVVVPPIETQRKVAAQYEVIEQVAVRASSAVEHLKRLRTGMLADLLSGTHQIPDSYDRFLDQEVA